MNSWREQIINSGYQISVKLKIDRAIYQFIFAIQLYGYH